MNKEAKKVGEYVTYIGNADTYRDSKFRWREFEENDLIISNKYEILGTMAAQWSFIKIKDEIVRDDSGERYLYYAIKNENSEKIYIWEGFFEENINL